VRQSIRIIVMTVPGERVMRPEFGCRIHELIFHPANYQTAAIAERYVREALTRWEPRITIENIRVTPGNGELGELTIEIDYKLKDHPDPRTFTYPFYLVPGENGNGGANK
jgi:phage baseplate assembly protein W